MKIGGYILVLIIGAAICFFLMRGCETKQGTQPLTDSIRIQLSVNDSLKKQLATVSFENQQVKERWGNDTVVYKHKIDSQSHIIAVLQGKFKITKDSIGSLYANLKTFYLNQDTVDLQNTYKRLSDELTDANNQLFAIQLARDSADNIRDRQIQSAHEVIDYAERKIDTLQKLLKSCTDNASALGKTATKATKKVKAAAILNKVEFGVAAILAAILFLRK